MFSSAAHAAVYFARRTVFTTLCKQARFLSVSAVSSTKNLYSESVLFSEKERKSVKTKRDNEKILEQSQLYPDELEKLPNNGLIKEFDWLIDDKTPLIQEDPASGKSENVAKKYEAVDKMPSKQDMQKSVWPESVAKNSEAVDKMPSKQDTQKSVWPESVAKNSEAVDKMPSKQEVQKSVWPESMAGTSEVVEGLKISEQKEIELQENDTSEILSDSDSDSGSEVEDYYDLRKRAPNNFQVDLKNLKIKTLKKKSKFFKEQMQMGSSQRDGLILNDEIGGIIALAKLGVLPEALFFCSSKILTFFPEALRNIALYQVPFEDMTYWSSRVKAPMTTVIGLYKEESFKLKISSSEPEMPLTIICYQFRHRLGFAEILNSVYTTPFKLFITSKDSVDPWHGSIVRNSYGHGIFLNHNFGLNWEEIRKKVDENARVYFLNLFTEVESGRAESHWSQLPSVDLYNHNFWDRENIALIVMYNKDTDVSQELSSFFSERNALRIDTGLRKGNIGRSAFHMVFFELRRQWLAAQSRNLSKSG